MNIVRARRTLRLSAAIIPVAALAVWGLSMEQPLWGVAAASALAVTACYALRSVAGWLGKAKLEQLDLKSQLIQSQKLMALGEISTGIAHEINNPLNIIMQEAELMRVTLDQMEGAPELDDVRESLGVVCQQVERCSDITHKLLDLARNHRPVTQSADINRLLMDMLALVERETASKNIQIVKMFGDNVPLIRTDPPLLRQVFLNLLNNAVQAVENGGFIFVTTRHRKGLVSAEIRDTGPGIPRDIQDRIFDPFFTTKEVGKGTGLGLSVSLKIINQLGGTLTLQSEQGQGTAFTVTVPADK